MMVESDPWLTLGVDYETAMNLAGNPSLERYVAVENDQPAGFLWLNMAGAFKGYIEDICVARDRRNHGIGSLLLDYAEKRVLSENHNVFLCVSSFNSRARELYRRRGYEYVGELKDYIIPGYSEFFMRKTRGPMFIGKIGAC